MSTFSKNSKAFQNQVANAAMWMIRRNVGHDHFWRWQALTSSNSDREAGRPIVENQTAQDIFRQLETKKLIAPISGVEPPPHI